VSIAYSERYPGRKAHAPYYFVIYSLSGSTHIFPHYLINCAIFGGKKMLLNKKKRVFLYFL